MNLPGITRICCLPCSCLQPAVALKAEIGIPVGVFSSLRNVRFYGNPEVSCKSKRENNGYSYETSLSFFTDEWLDVASPLAFVLETAQGKHYLIGTKEENYPIVEQERLTGTPSGDSAGVSVEVTWTSDCPMVECYITE